MALLEVRDLQLHYATPRGPLRAVDSVSFTLQAPGETLGIIGESGSGKSSLVLALTRVLPGNVVHYGGEVWFQGRDLMKLSGDAFRREIRWSNIAVVFQGAMNSFNPVLRMGFQLAERMLLDGTVSKRAAEGEIARLLELVGLPREILHRYPHELSGGMKQRAAIAMALAMEPPLVLLDEPTSALDVSVQAQIMNLLKQLKWDLGLSMLFITHDIALASDISDRIAVVHGGQMRESGSAEDVLTNPQDPYTQHLLASMPRVKQAQRPEFLTGGPPDLVTPPAGCRFQSRCPSAFGPCADHPPPLIRVGAAHWARCWLHGETEETESGP